MPRPVFGGVEWLRFEDLEDVERFPQGSNVHESFLTVQAEAADRLAEAAFGMDRDGTGGNGDRLPCWPGLEFAVGLASRRVLMVREGDPRDAAL